MQRLTLSLFLTALMTGLAVAQCNPVPPLTTQTSGTNGQKGTMFDIVNISTAPATILSFDQCFLNAGTSNVEIYTKTGTWSGFESTAAAWTLVGTALGVVHTAGPALDPIPLAVNVSIPDGATQAFYITSNAAFGTNVSYTTGVNSVGAVIGTDGILNVIGGVGKAYPFGTTFGLPTEGRIWNGRVNYCLGGTPAVNTVVGLGCIRQFTSLYEYFASPANFDLSGSGIVMLPSAGGYIVTRGGSFLPVGSVQTPPTPLELGDDDEVTQPLTVGSFMGPSGPWTQMSIISNGIVAEASGNTLVAAPSVTTLLASPQTGFFSQGDWDPVGGTGSGTIWFEESPTMISITWDNVKSWNVAGTNTFQMQFASSGVVTMYWVSMTPLGSNGGVMVGYSPAGPSDDPGNTDLSALGAGSIVLATTDNQPLALAGVTRAVTGTDWTLGVSNIPPSGVFGVSLFGTADPGILDLFFLGLPGCQLRSTLDVIAGPWLVGGPTANYSFAIPNTPTILNLDLFTQAAVWTVPAPNPFGAITSNGIRGTIGDI